MGRKAPKGYYVDGEFVVRGSADDAAATDDSPSRTARKKASEDLQRIGEGLLALRASALDELQLPEKLRDAIGEAQRFDNFVLLPPQTNNYGVLGRADAIVSVNSKSGAEAVLLGKPVVVMGDAFYRSCPLVFPVDRLSDVPQRLREALRSQSFDPARAAPYFETAWRQSFPGELYIENPQQLDTFATSLLSAVAAPAAAV